jgi:septum site-determining protein MinD
MSEVVGILSGKGGVGKTTVTANLGAALTDDFKKNVLILDSNLNSSHLGLHFGMYQDLPVTMRDILKQNVPVTYAIYVHPGTGIRILPAPLNGGHVNLNSRSLKEISARLTQDYNLVLMDCAPGLGKEVVTSVSAMDSALIVTTPDFPAVTDALKTIDLLRKMNKKVLGIVVNKLRGEKYELTKSEIESTCGVNVISFVPEDKSVPHGIANGTPSVLLSPYSRSSESFKRLAAKISGERYRSAGMIDRLKFAFSGPRFKPAPKMEARAFGEYLLNKNYLR